MSLPAASDGDVRRICEALGWDVSAEDVALFTECVERSLRVCERLDALAAPTPPATGRDPGRRPSAEEDPLRSWYWRCDVTGRADGPLAGRTIGLKDTISLAGVPMAVGVDLLDGFVPDEDATVVTRILEAGGRIVGKAACEALSSGGGSHTSSWGPIRNPHDPEHTSGGSSGGSAVVVATGDADISLGNDQGGSVRLPAAWCGVYGLKPTYGLVPYTGVYPIEYTLDHVGPLARTVADIALVLDAIAGPDGLDPRQPDRLSPPECVAALGRGVEGVRIGIVREGFGWAGVSEPDVDEAVREAARALGRHGCEVSDISIPIHRHALDIWSGIANEGIPLMTVTTNGLGSNLGGRFDVRFGETFGAARASAPERLFDGIRANVVIGEYLRTHHHGRYYGLGQNLMRLVREAYDRALEQVDVLVMPTMPNKAPRIPGPEADRLDRITSTQHLIANMAPFCATGHPALSAPCAVSEGLPVGMQLTGRRGEDALVLRVADHFERQIFPAPHFRPVVEER